MNDNCSECPETAKALESIPRFRTTFACFSALNPGTGLGKHFGPSNGILRCHLAVHIPEPDKTTITVCDETRHWEEGKVMIFDDSFEHQVSHKGSKTRGTYSIKTKKNLKLINCGLICDSCFIF